ncbi:FAD-binding protein [Streptomyces sp. TRM64462]|uniref:FAD-binding protein n=1 Tax=Streptomyces sp. TRM64462 TaxID=2741726 RepID=UPI001C31007D|nr:FAD-binding protein [Streptomyces sp. TRM64462]
MRNYGQYCPIARGSGIIAERWTPIILRNVLLGCRTFNEIAAGAPGLSRALLTRRLRELEHAGVVAARPKPDGHGSYYMPTPKGRELWPVLQALGDWAQRWMDVTAEEADPDLVVWSWCHTSLRRDLLPRRRVVVRFEFGAHARQARVWLLLEHGAGELCGFDPGFGEDVVVTVEDPLTFARWHLGLVEWATALKSGAVRVEGPRDLCRALPTWNGYPQVQARRRTEHERAPGGTAPPPPEAVPAAVAAPPRRTAQRAQSDTAAFPGFTGRLVTPRDTDYDAVRAVWNGAVDRRPRYIARCQSPSDVAAAIRHARERGLTLAVRGGGHGVAGTSVCDDGLVVDLAPMKSLTIDPADRTVTAGAGTLWGELDAATQAYGLATTGGLVSRTGISGLTLGGGLGWLMRRHGLAADRLTAAELITADGSRLTATARENPDVFRALRGGGPGIGVVTSFTYRMAPLAGEVLSGPVLWPLEDAPAVLRGYRDLVAHAPPEVATLVVLRRAPAAPFLPVESHGRPICMIAMLALAEATRAERLLAPLRALGRPLLDMVKWRPYTGLQTLFDTGVPPGWHYYWKSTGLRDLADPVIDTLVDHAAWAGSPRSYALLLHLGGAVADTDPEATTFTRRDVPFELNVNAVWLPHQPLGPPERAWARDYVAALAPHRSGVYVNFLDADDQDRAPEAYTPKTRTFLTELRARYDPDGVFTPPP